MECFTNNVGYGYVWKLGTPQKLPIWMEKIMINQSRVPYFHATPNGSFRPRIAFSTTTRLQMGLTSWRKMWGMFGHVWYQPSILQCETVTHPGICVRSWKFFRIYLPFLIPVSNCFRIIESGGFEYLPIFPMNFINRSPMIPYESLWIPYEFPMNPYVFRVTTRPCVAWNSAIPWIPKKAWIRSVEGASHWILWDTRPGYVMVI